MDLLPRGSEVDVDRSGTLNILELMKFLGPRNKEDQHIILVISIQLLLLLCVLFNYIYIYYLFYLIFIYIYIYYLYNLYL